MNPALTVKHRTGSYPIYIGIGLIERCGELLGEILTDSKNVIITDQNVYGLYHQRLLNSLASDDIYCHICPVGEASKSFSRLELILQELLNAGVDRKSTVIALGGGVPGDLAGFVAATYMRGLNFVQVPTTLLAQVDSSVGGKTGINLPNAKNSVGAFWQPRAVIIDPAVLKTLDKKEYTSGLAEVVKYGVIMDEDFFAFLESNAEAINNLDMPILETVITRCCQLKAQIVEEDERETRGRRAILNYGHTFGHAIESVFGYGTYPHGHAVAMGMQAAAHLAALLGRVEESFLVRQNNLLSALNLPICFPVERHEELYAAMQHDKKAVSGKVAFIMPDTIGHVDLVNSIEHKMIMKSMAAASANS